ncbi:MAG: PHB depolymerase family esterase [Gemmataceae bacterium]
MRFGVTIILTMLASTAVLGQSGSKLQKAFQRVDENDDGKLSAKEVNRFSKLKTRLKGADKDGDGSITFAEFRTQIIRTLKSPATKTGKLGAGNHLRVIRVGELERRYQVYVPAKYKPERATPVIVAFHGGGGNPTSMMLLSGLNKKADEAGFIVVYPYGSGLNKDRSLTFNGGNCCGYARLRKIDDVGFVRALLDDLAKAVNVDADRVFATGMSNGAIMTYLVASELSDRIAAVAPVGGPMGTDTCTPKRPVAVMHFHGTADQLAPFKGGQGKGTSKVPSFLRPKFYSVDHSIQNWVKANGCDEKPKVVALPDKAKDGLTVTKKSWGNGKEGSEVVLIEIKGGGHTWPGQKPLRAFLGKSTMDISANDMMWEFFQKHPRKRTPKSNSAPAGKPGSRKSLPVGQKRQRKPLQLHRVFRPGEPKQRPFELVFQTVPNKVPSGLLQPRHYSSSLP